MAHFGWYDGGSPAIVEGAGWTSGHLRDGPPASVQPSGLMMEDNMAGLSRITHDPAVMGGKACIRGMRVTVAMILGLMAAGRSREEILKAYPYLEAEDMDAALTYAAWRLEEREVPLAVA